MKLLLPLLLAAAACGAETPKDVKAVYLLPMTAGLDQYLASQLTTQGSIRVVTDPKLADAILTDSVGEGFEKKLLELYPPEAKPEKAKDKDDDAEMKGNELERVGTGWSRGRGNIFLVDRAGHTVLWSTFQKPKNSLPSEMNKTAEKIVTDLKKARMEPVKQ